MNKKPYEPATKAPERVHLPALDGIRGIAIVLVLVLHTFNYPPSAPFAAQIIALGDSCWIGVDLFFALSGFLITRALLDSKASSHYFRNFYLRRALRIAPLYYGVLLFAFVLLPLIPAVRASSLFRAMQAEQWWFWTYLANFWMAVNYLHKENVASLGGHFWSLAIEEQFYLVWPIVVLYLSPRGIRRFAVSYAIFAFLARLSSARQGADPVSIYVSTVMRVDTILFGAWLAALADTPGVLSRLRRYAPYVFVAALLALRVIAARNDGAIYTTSRVVQTIGYPIIAVASVTLIVMGIAPHDKSTRVQKVLSSRFLRFMGRYSYGIYVIHFPLLNLAIRSGFGWRELSPVFGSPLVSALWVTMAVCTASVALAMVSWQLIEQPFLRLKRYVPR